MKVLVTGGAGFLGSITAHALERAGHVPIILDSLITGRREFTVGREFYVGRVGDSALVQRILADHPDIAVTVHMAASVVVPESVSHPVAYYRNNVVESLALFETLTAAGHNRIVLSSSASVYASTSSYEVTEASPVGPASPYARTKLMLEQIMEDMAAAGLIKGIALRYFNPIGADIDLRSGTYARNPSHVLGQLVQTAEGNQPHFHLTGTDHPTRDGTGLRDYIHAWDLAIAHVRAVEHFDHVVTAESAPFSVINIGTGTGVTVRELIQSFERVSGVPVPVLEAPARDGDVVGAYANVDKAARLLHWRAELSIEDGIASALAWARKRNEILKFD